MSLVNRAYGAAFVLCGDGSLGPLRLAAAAAQLLTALALASTARRRWGDRAGRAAGVLYLLVSVGLNPEDAQAATFEVFMLPFTAAAVRTADRGPRPVDPGRPRGRRSLPHQTDRRRGPRPVTGSELHVLLRG